MLRHASHMPRHSMIYITLPRQAAPRYHAITPHDEELHYYVGIYAATLYDATPLMVILIRDYATLSFTYII